jgi:acyl-CoA hydrolase
VYRPRVTAKRPTDSKVEMTQIVLPAHTNRFGTVFGGTVMSWIDICAAVAAMRHAGNLAVTASMDQVHFLSGARTGDVMVLRAQVNWVGRTSMEVGVRADREDPVTGEHEHTASAYLTFVAVDGDGRPQPVPGLEPETETERARWTRAEERRARRLADRAKVQAREASKAEPPAS